MTTINWLFCYRVVVVLVIHFQKRLFFFLLLHAWLSWGGGLDVVATVPLLLFSPPSPSPLLLLLLLHHHLRHRHLRPRPAVGPGMNDLFPPAGFSSLVFLDASFEIVAVQDFAIRRLATTGDENGEDCGVPKLPKEICYYRAAWGDSLQTNAGSLTSHSSSPLVFM